MQNIRPWDVMLLREDTDKSGNLPIRRFNIAMAFGAVRGTHSTFNVMAGKEILEFLGLDKLGPAIRDNELGKAKDLDNISLQDFHCLFGGNSCSARKRKAKATERVKA